MEVVSVESVFNNVEIDSFEVAPLPKVVDNRGFMYLIEDTAYPGFIKIGRTINMKKRLAIYNADKPYNTSKLIAVSREFVDVVHVEKKILEYLYSQTSPTTYSREWFLNEHREVCLQLIADAEDAFD